MPSAITAAADAVAHPVCFYMNQKMGVLRMVRKKLREEYLESVLNPSV